MSRQFAIMVRRDDGAELRAGEWRRGSDDVWIACPCCGATSYMTPEHQIDADGYVSPLWLCVVESCPMVGVWLLLEGYRPNVIVVGPS